MCIAGADDMLRAVQHVRRIVRWNTKAFRDMCRTCILKVVLSMKFLAKSYDMSTNLTSILQLQHST